MVTPLRRALRATHLLIVLVVILCGCSKPDPISTPMLVRPPGMEGSWLIVGSGGVSINARLTQRAKTVEGSCTFSIGGASAGGSVNGLCTYPDVSFMITIPGYYAIRFTGQMSGSDAVNGVLDESGFSTFPVSGSRR